MFSKSFTRAAHRCASRTPAAASTSSSTTSAIPCTCHQRRLSSSKAHSPPDSSKSAPTGKVAASTTTVSTKHAAKLPTSTSQSDHPTSSPKRLPRPYKRHPRIDRPAAKNIPLVVDHFAGLPSVPSVQHLHQQDVTLSRFFSLHRPLALTITIPPTTSQHAFDRIFELSESKPHPWANGNSAERRPEDVIYTLHNTIDWLEQQTTATAAPEDSTEGVRWEVIHESPSHNDGVKHLDGAPPVLKNLDELVAQFKPFRVPPPPQPFLADPPSKSVTSATEKRRLARQLRQNSPDQTQEPAAKQESFATTIIVTASTFADGQRTFRASSSPIMRIPNPEPEVSPNAEQPPSRVDTLSPPSQQQLPAVRQPFLDRMRRRQRLQLQTSQQDQPATGVRERSGWQAPNASGRQVGMILISVRRQRKLKMKKHKYKKLMRKTRTIRRKLEKN